MTSKTAPPIVKVRSTADIVGIVPYQLGFQPTESIVILCLHGSRRRVGLTMRHDLVEPGHEAELAAYLAAAVARDGASAVIVVIYTAGSDDDGLPRRSLVDALAKAGLPGTAEAMLVRDGRCWSYLCDDAACCPPSGVPVPQRPTGAVRQLAAEAALAGQAVLPDRATLEASILPPRGRVAETARAQATEAAAAAVASGYEANGAEHARADSIALIEELAGRWAAGDHSLARAEAALAVVSLRDKAVRDHAAAVALEVPIDAYLALLVQLCRSADPPEAAPIATVLAWVAYMHGDGALANVAIDRALVCEPGYTMAELLLTCLQGQIPPAEVRRLTLRGLSRRAIPAAGRKGTRTSSARRAAS